MGKETKEVQMDNLGEEEEVESSENDYECEEEEQQKNGNTAWNVFKFWLHEALMQIKYHAASYVLGFCACLMVVIVVAVLLSIIGNAPIVYLRIAEMQQSEMDLRIRGTSPLEVQYLNYSHIASVLDQGDSNGNKDRFSYHSLRWYLGSQLVIKCSNDVYQKYGNTTSWAFYGDTLNISDNSTYDPCVNKRNCFRSKCGKNTTTTTDVLFSDTIKDKRILLGRSWNFPKPVGVGAAYVSEELSVKLSLNVGDHFYLPVNPWKQFSSLWERMHSKTFKLPSPNSSQEYDYVDGDWADHDVILPLTVAGIYDDGGGRISSDLSTGIILEYDTLGEIMLNGLQPNDTAARKFFSTVNMSEYAEQVVVNMPPPRTDVYLHSDMDTVRKLVTQFSSEVTYRLGYLDLDVKPVVMSTLDPFAYVSIFLGLIINMSVFVLMLLCVVLIYSLLVINVESRTFEMGVMRMIGTKRSGLVGLLLTQAMTYAVPAIIIGLPLAQLLGLGVFKVISHIASVDFPNLLTWQAVLVAAALGIIIPVISAILPIRSALMLNLADSIDSNRSKTKAVVVTINRSEQNHVSKPMLFVGLFLTFYGVGIYLIFPAALLAFNISLILYLLFILLILILFGCVMLALTLEGLFSRLIAFVFFFWDKQAIRSLLNKNLVAHRLRNRKTIMMYSMSLSFIIFLSVSFSQQMAMVSTTSEQAYGSSLGVQCTGINQSGYPYTVGLNALQEIEKFLKTADLVDDFAYATVDLSVLTSSKYTLSNIGRMAESTVHIYGISPNYFELAYPQYLAVGERVINGTLPKNISIGEQAYTVQGSQGFILGSALKETLGITIDDQYLVNEIVGSGSSSSLLGAVGGMVSSFFGGGSGGVSAKAGDPPPIRKNSYCYLSSAGGLTMSKYTSISDQSAVVSFPHYISLTRGKISGMRDIPIARVFIKINEEKYDQDVFVKMKSQLKDIVSNTTNNTAKLWDVQQLSAGMDLADEIIQYFFILTTVIAMVTSFFSLSSSMLANIYEQTKEIAILRAVGMTKPWLYRVYVYEAFVVVFGSSLMGLLVGTLLAWAFTINQSLFTQLPLPFSFPWLLTVVVFGLSIIFSLFASLSPIYRVVSKRIINIMRMMT